MDQLKATVGRLFWQVRKRTRPYADNATPLSVKTADPTWLAPEHWSRLVCFVHVPKAAGTSFKSVLWNVYGRGFLNYHTRISKFSPSSITASQAKDILAIGGHLPYGFHEGFGDSRSFTTRDVLYVAIVRHPVDRLLSLARFVRTFRAHALYHETKHMTCAEFFDHMIETKNNSIIGNGQSAMISPGNPEGAIEQIETKFAAVSTLKAVPELISYIGDALDWPAVSLPHKNKSTQYKTTEQDRKLAQEICDQRCKADLALYEHVASKPSGLLGNL